MERFISWLLANGQAVGADSLGAYLEYQSRNGASASTVCGYFYAIKTAMVAWREYTTKEMAQTDAALLGWTLAQAIDKIHLPRVMKGKRAKMIQSFREEQLDEVIVSANPRIGAMIEFLADTGVRVSEMCDLRLKSIRPFDPEKAFVTIMGKGDKERAIWISDALLARIRRLFRGEVYLFETSTHRRMDPDNVYKMIRQAFLRTSGIALTPHNLRHYLATRLLRMGASTRAVGEHLGHSDPSTTAASYDVSQVTVEQLKTNHHGNRGRRSRKEKE